MTRLQIALLVSALLVLLLVAWLPAQAAAPAQTPTLPATGTVTANANLRAGPGTTYDRTGSAQSGDTVQVVACNDGCTWYKLDSGAWIFAELVQVQSAASPAQTAPPSTAPAPAASGQATAADNANLRSGPGAGYERVGGVKAGQTLELAGRSEAGDWYRLADGTWIAAFLVNGAPGDLPAAAAQPAESVALAPAPAVAQAPAAPAQPAQEAGSPNVTIRTVYYDGGVYRVESDEYAEVINTGSAPTNLNGWMLNAGDPGQNFRFPSYELAPGDSCRVYTNESHPESCGFSFGSGRAIWNNKGDCGYLFDAAGAQVDSYCY